LEKLGFLIPTFFSDFFAERLSLFLAPAF